MVSRKMLCASMAYSVSKTLLTIYKHFDLIVMENCLHLAHTRPHWFNFSTRKKRKSVARAASTHTLAWVHINNGKTLQNGSHILFRFASILLHQMKNGPWSTFKLDLVGVFFSEVSRVNDVRKLQTIIINIHIKMNDWEHFPDHLIRTRQTKQC